MTKWQRYMALAASLAVLAIVLTVTSAGSAIAQGALRPIEALIINNTANPVPVTVTNSGVSVAPQEPITSGGSQAQTTCNNSPFNIGAQVATALSIRMSAEVANLQLRNGSDIPALFNGPAQGGNATIVLALTRPIAFNNINCTGGGGVSLSWIGNAP